MFVLSCILHFRISRCFWSWCFSRGPSGSLLHRGHFFGCVFVLGLFGEGGGVNLGAVFVSVALILAGLSGRGVGTSFLGSVAVFEVEEASVLV